MSGHSFKFKRPDTYQICLIKSRRFGELINGNVGLGRYLPSSSAWNAVP